MEWQKWCRLCGSKELEKIGCNSLKAEINTDLPFIIQKYFSINLAELHGDENNICFDCKSFLQKLEQFNHRCMKASALFCQILSANEQQQTNPIYLEKLRVDAGLDEFKKGSKVEFSDSDNESHEALHDESVYTMDFVEQCYVSAKLEIDNSENASSEHISDDEEAKPKRKSTKQRKPESKRKSRSKKKKVAKDVDSETEDVKTAKRQRKRKTAEAQELNQTNDDVNEEEKIKTKRQRVKSTNNITFTCSICMETFKIIRYYENHMKENHPEEKGIFPCAQCSKRYPSWGSLKCHEKSHLPDELKLSYPCKYCDKRFLHLVNVQVHMRAIHENDRPFICEECGKGYATSGALKEHQLVHTDEHPFQCDTCEKRFKSKPSLKRHLEVHSNVLHICPECGLQLSTRVTLQRHMLCHSEEKRFKCKFCGSEFKRSKSLKVHLIQHSGLKPYECPFCDKTFGNGANFRSHKKKAHPVELAALEANQGSLPPTSLPRLDELR